MKRTLSFMVMALALLLTQCRKPEVKFPSPVAPEGTTVSMTVTAGPGSKTDITTAGAITWSEGDKLYVGYNGEYVGCLTLTSGQNTPTGWFSGNVTLPTGTENGDKTFHFFYLGSDNNVAPTVGATSVNVFFNEQNIYNNGGKLENAKKFHVGYGTAKGTVAGSEVTGINVTLVSKVALARFSFTKDAAAYMDVLTLSGTNIYNSMTVGFGGSFNHGATSGSISLTGGHGERYVMLVPTGDATEQTLTFAGSSDEGEGKVPGLESNKFYGKTDAIAVTLTASAVHVTSVSLNETSLSLAVGGTATLTATVAPDNATDKSVTWSSTDESVATVADGTVTAVAAGTATIRVTTVDGNKTATCAVTVTAAPTPTTHVFSVDANGTKVEFSPGNLQYIGSATTPYWKFAEHQWDYLGKTIGQESSDTNVDRDLFGWGCTGYQDTRAHAYQTKYQPYSTSKTPVSGGSSINYYGYGPDYYDSSKYGLTVGNKSDWGCLAIGGDPAGTWRTLTSDEWVYLFNTRTVNGGTGDGKSYQRATINSDATGVYGLLLYPDGYTSQTGATTYTAAEFTAMEQAGVVFLPAAGCRVGTSVGNVDDFGFYWSSSCDSSTNAHEMYFYSTSVNPQGTNDRYRGFSVRLVR